MLPTIQSLHIPTHSNSLSSTQPPTPSRLPRPLSSNDLLSTLQPTSSDWTPESWRSKPIQQQPQYNDADALQSALSILSRLPPLVHPEEILNLRQQLAQVAAGKRFLLQGGDCSERFVDCTKYAIESKLKIMLQMSLVLIWGARLPVVRIGRVAGQYGKPRSSPTERLNDGTVISSFRGDNVNGFEATVEARVNDPHKLVLGHFHSAATLNYIRALIAGGAADLHQSTGWQLKGIKDATRLQQYQRIAASITDALDFMEVCGIQDRHSATVTQVDFFTSHEALILEYESIMTRPFQLHNTNNETTVKYFNTSAHFVWIGNRTRALTDAHIEYVRGIVNPIGIKVDAAMGAVELIELLRSVDPHREAGRVTLITRFGRDKINTELPKLIRAVQQDGRQDKVVWSCDPMHGNTITTSSGFKTRRFEDILTEFTLTFECHAAYGSQLNAVHFEMTGEDVTECVGGGQELQVTDLPNNYSTQCDPRLNYLQSMEMSYAIADMMSKRSKAQ